MIENLLSLARSLCLVAVLGAFSGCGRSEAEFQKLLAENRRLQAELEATKIQINPGSTGTTHAPTPDLDLTMEDLWAQRFDDNAFRADKRLTNKVIRVSGLVETTRENDVTLYYQSKRFGKILRMTVKLEPVYASKVKMGIASLERNAAVVAQGRFQFDRMGLNDGFFVEPATGRVLLSEDLAVPATSAKEPPPAAATATAAPKN